MSNRMSNDTHRPYFEREIVFRRRLVFLWRVEKRWPDATWLHGPDGRTCIEGVEFATEQACADFALDGPVGWERFDTWEDAEAWVRGEPKTADELEREAAEAEEAMRMVLEIGDELRKKVPKSG